MVPINPPFGLPLLSYTMSIASRRDLMTFHLLIKDPVFVGHCYGNWDCWSKEVPPWIAHIHLIKDPIFHYSIFFFLNVNHCCIFNPNAAPQLFINKQSQKWGWDLLHFFVHDLPMAGPLRLTVWITEPRSPLVNNMSCSHLSSLMDLVTSQQLVLLSVMNMEKEEDKENRNPNSPSISDGGNDALSS